MIFQHTWQAVLENRKTQTRRLVKPNHHALNVWRAELGSELRIGESGDSDRIGVVQAAGRDIWQVGKTYAVQPARGQKAVARIRILSIRREDVREISIEDAKAEGFDSRLDFIKTWINMHDKEIYKKFSTYDFPIGAINPATTLIKSRPAERYDAWALTFEVVK